MIMAVLFAFSSNNLHPDHVLVAAKAKHEFGQTLITRFV